MINGVPFTGWEIHGVADRENPMSLNLLQCGLEVLFVTVDMTMDVDEH